MGEDKHDEIMRCLEQLAQPHLATCSAALRVPDYPTPWLLLDLLQLLPDSNNAKQEVRQSQEQLVKLVAAADADEGQGLQLAGRLFTELAFHSIHSRRQLAEHLCTNLTACSLLVNAAEHACSGGGGGGSRGSGSARSGCQQQGLAGVAAERLCKAQCSIAASVWEVVGTRYSQRDAQRASPAVVVRALGAATLVCQCSEDAALAVISQHGQAVLLANFDWLQQCAARQGLGQEEKVSFTRTMCSWAVHASLALLVAPCTWLCSASGTCRKLVDSYCGATLGRLAGHKGRVRSSWFELEGPLMGLARVFCNVAEVLAFSRSDVAWAAARSIVTDHASALLSLLVRCLGLVASEGGGPYSSTPLVQGGSAKPGVPACAWRGRTRDAHPTALVLAHFAASGLELAVVMYRQSLMGHLAPRELLGLEHALHAVATGSARASWLPPDTHQRLLQDCGGALHQLEPLSAELLQRRSRQPESEQWEAAAGGPRTPVLGEPPRPSVSPGPGPPQASLMVLLNSNQPPAPYQPSPCTPAATGPVPGLAAPGAAPKAAANPTSSPPAAHMPGPVSPPASHVRQGQGPAAGMLPALQPPLQAEAPMAGAAATPPYSPSPLLAGSSAPAPPGQPRSWVEHLFPPAGAAASRTAVPAGAGATPPAGSPSPASPSTMALSRLSTAPHDEQPAGQLLPNAGCRKAPPHPDAVQMSGSVMATSGRLTGESSRKAPTSGTGSLDLPAGPPSPTPPSTGCFSTVKTTCAYVVAALERAVSKMVPRSHQYKAM